MKDLPEVYARWRQFPLVSISDSQRICLPRANWMGTVYHGMPASLCRVTQEPRGYLAFLGRMSPEKGPDRAIAIAKAVGIPLKMAAKVDPADRAYFETEIRPLLDHPLIEFIGEIGDADKSEFLGGAKALLFPIEWPEPFGLVMIEAMACGTPVLAFPEGAAPEVVDDGRTGFLCGDEAAMVDAITRLPELSRADCRAAVEGYFSTDRMVAEHIELFESMVG